MEYIRITSSPRARRLAAPPLKRCQPAGGGDPDGVQEREVCLMETLPEAWRPAAEPRKLTLGWTVTPTRTLRGSSKSTSVHVCLTTTKISSLERFKGSAPEDDLGCSRWTIIKAIKLGPSQQLTTASEGGLWYYKQTPGFSVSL